MTAVTKEADARRRQVRKGRTARGAREHGDGYCSRPRASQPKECLWLASYHEGITPGSNRSDRSFALAASPINGEEPPVAFTWKISCIVRRSDEWV